jgi:hypothetical protein
MLKEECRGYLFLHTSGSLRPLTGRSALTEGVPRQFQNDAPLASWLPPKYESIGHMTKNAWVAGHSAGTGVLGFGKLPTNEGALL